MTVADYKAKSVLYVPDESRLSHLVELPEGADVGKAVDEAIKAIEAANPELKDVLPRGYQKLEHSTLIELLRLFAAYAAEPHDPETLLDAVGLADVAGTAVKRLSGGQQQRLSLAMALVGRPELVFLDEPTAGMDPQARRATWDFIRKLRTDGVSVVLTTHFLDEAEQLADTVVVIDAGRVVAAGSPAELTRAGAEGQIRFRAPSGLRLDSLLSALPAGTHAVEESSGHYLVTGDVDPQLLATLTAWCAGQGVLAENLAVERRTLEDVFLELTGREVRT